VEFFYNIITLIPGKKPATQKTCNAEVCTYDYPNGHHHFDDDKEDKDDDQDKGMTGLWPG
jgi:hypothetical protein